MPKQELSLEDKIKQATEDVREAMLENIEASRIETTAKIRKQKAHFDLQKASERLQGLRIELME